ncbi:Druantia anti-phage system protein DruA [Roseivivax halodurans]|uniref:Druantia anti-phage system protein DruA n=1 Tax=Roseivivax halodurans TaxID=93683 RepID=UPI001B7FAA64|nr:Druantia anti-phage system protein DruA [Roseivivax halodurans]
MKHKSIVVSSTLEKDGRTTPEYNFLRSFHRDLRAFGRYDISLVIVGKQAFFSWSVLYNRTASKALRAAVSKSRLEQNRQFLDNFEQDFPGIFSTEFDIDTDRFEPEIVECSDDPDQLALFRYFAHQQSMASKVARGRFARFCIFDASVKARPLAGIIGLSSPVYFNGARDGHVGWGPIRNKIGDDWVPDVEAKARRDKGLLHVSHVTISTPIPPYDKLKFGKLISALCFSPEVIGYLEEKYGCPIVALTTTGGWGVNAAPYQRIRLGRNQQGDDRHLFHAVEPKHPSLNTTLDYFSDDTVELALEMHKGCTNESSTDFENWREKAALRNALLQWSLKYLGIPRKAAYVNEVGHFFGSVTDQATQFLNDVRSNDIPKERTIQTSDALSYWRSKTERSVRENVSTPRLSEDI